MLVWGGLVSSTARVFVTGYAVPHDRDKENAYVAVNGKVCWTQAFPAPDGSQECGGLIDNWREESVAVTCEAESVDGKLTVRAYTDLDRGGFDESFAIDNVVVTKTHKGYVVYLASR